jgi:MFS-type transporter involved in bile tolerance (Atg22 family)
MAVYAMTFMGMAPLGALLAGAMATRLGAPNTVAIGGAAAMVAAAVFTTTLTRQSRHFEVSAPEVTVSEQFAGGDPAASMTGVEMAEDVE